MKIINHNRKKRALTFCTSFNLGFPINIISKDNYTGWDAIRSEIINQFKQGNSDFEVLKNKYEEIVEFPGGKPVFLRLSKFFKEFPIDRYLYDCGMINELNSTQCSNEIWICPTGVTLLVGNICFDKVTNFSIEKFDLIIQDNYLELSKIFISIADIIYGSTFKGYDKQIFCDRTSVKQIWQLTKSLHKSTRRSTDRKNECLPSISKFLESENNDDELALSILNDVYYIDVYPCQDDEIIDVNYFSATIKCSNDESLVLSLLIVTTFSCFWEFIWFNRYLIQRMKETQIGLFDISKVTHQTIAELKLIRLYILQFFNESSPINIRLTRKYMLLLEECWKRFRMADLSDQVKEQLATLTEMIDWFDGIHREIRNYKIAAIGLIFTIISFLAVASDLSDIFISPILNYTKFYHVLSGGIFGIILTLFVIFFPIHKWYPRLKKCTKK